MDLIHELCPLQLLEVTKKSDILSVWLASIQHLAHMKYGWLWWRIVDTVLQQHKQSWNKINYNVINKWKWISVWNVQMLKWIFKVPLRNIHIKMKMKYHEWRTPPVTIHSTQYKLTRQIFRHHSLPTLETIVNPPSVWVYCS